MLTMSRATILEFFDKADVQNLVIYLDGKDTLTPTLDFPTELKKKAVFFHKNSESTVTKDNVTTLLSFGDLSYQPVEQMSAMVNGVFLPLLSNEDTKAQWPSVISEDVVNQAKVGSCSAFVRVLLLD